MREHYLLPDAPCAISFSGGRSSGYMLAQILDAYDGKLPDHVKVMFANTGKERPETLDFIHEFERHFGVDVAWLEYEYDATAAGGRRDPKYRHKVVNYDTAARDGEPFEALINSKVILPSLTMRLCTVDLKIKTMQRWMRRELGWSQWHPVLGIRADEPRRLHRGKEENCELGRIYPLATAGATHPQIMDWWKKQPFDLKLHSHQSNCDLCFLKSTNIKLQLIRDDPTIADWWIAQEEGVGAHRARDLDKPQQAQFSARYTYAELVEMAKSQIEFDFTNDEDSIDCFCTD